MGVDFGDNKDGTYLDDPRFQETLQFIRDMGKCIPPGLGSMGDEGPFWNAFHQEKVMAFAVNGSWHEAEALANNVNLGVAPLPLPEGGQVANCLVGNWIYAVPVGVPEDQTDLFWKFFREICLSEENQLLLLNKHGINVGLESILSNPANFEGEGKQSLLISAQDLQTGTFSGLSVFSKNDAQIWEILCMNVLSRTTASNDPIDVICSEAKALIDPLLQ
jgi:ABC-type glycerol-3-phosphate transport system substrate-binding protein